MDRITRSSTFSQRTNNIDESKIIPSPAKRQRSAIAATAGLISEQLDTQAVKALQPPPVLGELSRPQSPPQPEIENLQIPAPLSENVAVNEGLALDEMLQESSKSLTAGIEVDMQAHGGMHLKFPAVVTDDVLVNFVLVHCNPDALSYVTSVDLTFCKQLSGASLLALSQGLPALNSLNLTGCSQFNDNDLVHISQMVNLKNLSIAGCDGISKAGLINLSSVLDNVDTLDLTSCPQIDDEVLSSLPNMYQLKNLILTACTQFSDSGLRALGKLKKLESLVLDQCPQISNSSLLKISAISATGFRKLTHLNVSNCPRVTQQGIFSLKQTLPWLRAVNTGL
jgi:hypothetical protein